MFIWVELFSGWSQKVKQIGNSVPVRTAKAMCAADLPRKEGGAA